MCLLWSEPVDELVQFSPLIGQMLNETQEEAPEEAPICPNIKKTTFMVVSPAQSTFISVN